jgi:hypothetical protein
MGKTRKSSGKRPARKKARSSAESSTKKGNGDLTGIVEESRRQEAQKAMPSKGKLKSVAKSSIIPAEWWDEPLPFSLTAGARAVAEFMCASIHARRQSSS